MASAPPRPGGPQAVCVLGMHRSGTSLISRLLNLLGVYLGPEERLLRANRFNPKGFWEYQPIVELNDTILSRLGGSWREPPPFPPGWEASEALADLRLRARELLAADFAAAPLWGWKDPRTCLTLPFWRELVPDVRYVLCFRNPADVGHSLEHTMPFDQGVRLWLRYVSASLGHAAGRDCLAVFYEDFMQDWRRQLERLAAFLGREELAARADVLAEAEAFLDEELQHHRTSPVAVAEEPRIAFPAKALYAALRLCVGAGAGGVKGPDRLASGRFLAVVAGQAVHAEEGLRELNARAAAYEAEKSRAAARLAEKDQVIQGLRDEAGSLRSARDAEVAELKARVAAGLRDREILAGALAQRTDNEMTSLLRAIHDDLLAHRDEIRSALLSPQRRQGPTEALAGAAGSEGRAEYPELARRFREAVCGLVPVGSTVLVVSKGDEGLLRLGSRRAWHFPRDPGGGYAGHHPADSTAAVAHLEQLRGLGAGFLAFPRTAFWWLDFYGGLRRYLEEHCTVAARTDDCLVFSLGEPALPASPGTGERRGDRREGLAQQFREVVCGLVPRGATVLVVSKGDEGLLRLGSRRAWHFPRDPGGYAGQPPGDSGAAVAHLEELRGLGAGFLAFPRTAFWWLDFYGGLRRHLETHHRLVTHQRHVCALFSLHDGGARARQAHFLRKPPLTPTPLPSGERGRGEGGSVNREEAR
jgi:hypothetical protein